VEQKTSSAGLWIGIGCGALFFLTLCAGGGVMAWLTLARSGGRGVATPVISPIGPGPMPSSGPGVGPQLPPPPMPAGPSDAAPRQVLAVVQSASGLAGVGASTECRITVARATRPDGTFWCKADAMCGTTLVYGGGTAGYFNCQLYESPRRDVVGRDTDTTSGDRDAAFELDTQTGTLRVRDDATGALGAFSIEARVVYVR